MGLGYIGLPTAIIAAKHGVEIAGVDINAQVVEVTNQGKLHIIEPGMEEMLQEVAGGTGLRTFQGVHRASGERRLFHGGTYPFQGGS